VKRSALSRHPLNICLAAAIASFGLIMPAARADEIWMADGKMVQWLESKGDTAVFKMNNVYFYIEGLTYNSERGTHTGYWVTRTNAQRRCATFREFHGGRNSYTWGRFRIRFIGDSFPYKWVAKLGECDGKVYKTMNAIPMMQAD
tara:strand:- start:156 stop:590 length:435 start_codon:yes stop_codon:yes gene_type:complete